ncbi:MAG: hypothetical protein QXR19_04870 [Candidatus Jordarchaeaceae archaeon]
MRTSSGLAVIFFGLLLIIGVYGVSVSRHTDLVWGGFKFPLIAYMYHSQFGQFQDVTYPFLIGSYTFGGSSVFPVFSGGKSIFLVPGTYSGCLEFSLVSSAEVNVSIYSLEEFMASLFWGGGTPLFSASNVVGVSHSQPFTSGLLGVASKVFLDTQLFPSPSLTASTLPPLVVSIENQGVGDAFVSVNSFVWGYHIVQNPQYLFSWAILLFSAIFTILALLSEAVPRITADDIYEGSTLKGALKIALREPIRVVLPYTLLLAPILYVANYNIWVAGRGLFFFQSIYNPFAGSFSGAPVPFPLEFALLGSTVIFLIPIIYLAQIVVYSRVGAIHFEAAEIEPKQGLGGAISTYLVVGVMLSAILLYADFHFFTSMAAIVSYYELYRFGFIALILAFAIPIATFIFSIGYTLKIISASADRDERSPGEIVSEMWQPKRSLLKTYMAGSFLPVIGFILTIIVVSFLNPFCYPTPYIFSPVVETSVNTLLLSGSLIISAILGFFLVFIPIMQTITYFRLKEEPIQKPAWKTLARQPPPP